MNYGRFYGFSASTNQNRRFHVRAGYAGGYCGEHCKLVGNRLEPEDLGFQELKGITAAVELAIVERGPNRIVLSVVGIVPAEIAGVLVLILILILVG